MGSIAASVPSDSPYDEQLRMFLLTALTRRSIVRSSACLLLAGGLIASGAVAARAELTDGLVGYWPFDGDGTDASGNDRPLDLVGQPEFSSGLLGEALHLHGDPSQYATRPVVDEAFNFGGSDFSIQAWVNFDSEGGEQTIIEQFVGSDGPAWTVTTYSAQTVRFWADWGKVWFDSPLTGSELGQWGQILVRREEDLFQAFYNGVEVGSTSYSDSLEPSDLPLLIGNRNPLGGAGYPLFGLVDEVAIWNRALSVGEITQLYQDGRGLSIRAPTTRGDANGDGTVDLEDFGILKANFGSGATLAEGDFDGNGQVDLADFGVLKANFGTAAAASAPEPSGMLLAACGLVGLMAACCGQGHCRRYRYGRPRYS